MPQRSVPPLARDGELPEREQMIGLVEQAGIVGMGGAMFPTADKLRLSLRHPIDTLIINGSECEPYLTCDDRLMQEQGVQILGGIGISDETPVGMIFSDIRAFRLYDGPTEVHKYAIARQVLRSPR